VKLQYGILIILFEILTADYLKSEHGIQKMDQQVFMFFTAEERLENLKLHTISFFVKKKEAGDKSPA